VAFFPNLSRAEKIDFLQGLTVFSVPALYGEAFGLYLIEALAAGVPVVQPRHAAFPELVASHRRRSPGRTWRGKIAGGQDRAVDVEPGPGARRWPKPDRTPSGNDSPPPRWPKRHCTLLKS
jgi:hypothetical protein